MSDWCGATFINELLHTHKARLMSRNGLKLTFFIPGRGNFILVDDGNVYHEFWRLARFLGLSAKEISLVTSPFIERKP